MTEEERISAEVERRLEQHRKQENDFEDAAKKIFAPMTSFLEEWKNAQLPAKVSSINGKVDIFTTIQKTQGREIKELKGKVDNLSDSMVGVRERLAAVPGDRSKELQKALADHKKECVNGSGLIDVAEERGRAEAERLIEAARAEAERLIDAAKAAAKPMTPISTNPDPRRHPAIRFLQSYFLYILIGLAAIGSWASAAMNSEQPEKIEQAVEKTEQGAEDTRKAIAEFRALLESVAANPPATFELDAGL